MRRSIQNLAAGLTLSAGALWSGGAAAQPADMEAFDAQEAARGRPSLAWSRPASGLTPGMPSPQSFGPAYGGSIEGPGYFEGGYSGAGSGYFGGGAVLLGPIVVTPDHRRHGLRPDHRPRHGAHGFGHAEPTISWRRGYSRGHRHGYREGLRHGRRQGEGAGLRADGARHWAPGRLNRGGSAGVGARNAAKLRRARNWSYY